ncbi:MAG: TIGR00282 family metallophosphoesterase [Patescibacteria group bacterium]
MNKSLKILFIGDIVGKPGRKAVAHFVPLIRKAENIDLVVANGENLAGGSGMTFEKYKEMIETGVDYLTSGNHIWKNRDIIPYMKDNSVKVLRPANYPNNPPGQGMVSINVAGVKVVLANLLGRVFIPDLVQDPFSSAGEIVDSSRDSIIIIDFHAEATSEKAALAHFLDGKVSAVLGTHTHVQTADESILEKGTAFISDVGMCGPKDSVLGVDKGIIIKGFLTGLPQSHKVALGESIFNGVIIEIDKKTKKALSISRIFETYQ